MNEVWDHEPCGAPEIVSPAPNRYPLPKACVKAMRLLRPNERVALDEMIARYRRAANEKPVAITVRQLAQACNMKRMAAQRAIAALVERGFIVVFEPGSFYIQKRKPSRYRLTMFACNGDDATHDYFEDVAEWRRAGKRKPPSTLPPTVKVTWTVTPSQATDVFDAVNAVLGTPSS